MPWNKFRPTYVANLKPQVEHTLSNLQKNMNTMFLLVLSVVLQDLADFCKEVGNFKVGIL